MAPPAGRLPPRGGINSNSNISSSATSLSSTMTVPRSPQPAAPSLTVDTEFLLLSKPIPFSEARDVSASSREGLRRQVHQRRMSLTSSEQRFLDRLVVDGNEIEVQLAMEKLQDEDLFFEYQTPRHLKHHNSANNASNSEEERETAGSPRPSLDRQCSTGSHRRLQILEQRKQSTTMSQMWKAHETGLAVTQSASKRSLLSRREVSSGSNSRGRDQRSESGSSAKNSNGAIFRARPTKPPRPHYRRSQSLAAPPPIPEPRPLLGQQHRRSSTTSSGRRKSVTFHEQTDGIPKPRPNKNTTRRSVSDTIGYQPNAVKVPKEQQLQRQKSASSIPSLNLHPARPIRSESMTSMGSIPSIHHAHSVRSVDRMSSYGSIPSLHHANSIRSISSGSTIGSIPSLHHGHAQDEDDVDDNDGVVAKEEQDGKAPLVAQHTASDDIASAWLQQEQKQQKIEREESYSSLPQDVTFPSTVSSTETTEASTAAAAEQEDADDTNSPKNNTNNNNANKPVLMRRASRNAYNGEGIEVTELDDAPMIRPGAARRFNSMGDASVLTCSSFDTAYSNHHDTYSRGYGHDYEDIFRGSAGAGSGTMIRNSLSDEDMSNLFLGMSANLFINNTTGKLSISNIDDEKDENDGDDSSWDMNSDSGRFNSWNVLKDEYVNGYGGGGTLGFQILGTCADDESAQPHVLSPPLMESLQAFLPYSKSGENFFLKYSMVRDGASLHTFLKRARGCQYSIMAIETIDGEVFGCFTSQAWRKNWNYFGTGESFLWRMRRSRMETTNGILEQAQLESEIDVFPYTGENRLVQLCTHDRVAVGGGTPTSASGETKSAVDATSQAAHEWGFGLAIQGDFLAGTSSPCVTFASPSLSKTHDDGSLFEIINVELWTLTPCLNTEEAEKLELGKLFLERN